MIDISDLVNTIGLLGNLSSLSSLHKTGKKHRFAQVTQFRAVEVGTPRQGSEREWPPDYPSGATLTERIARGRHSL
jgi:hypothetical protein